MKLRDLVNCNTNNFAAVSLIANDKKIYTGSHFFNINASNDYGIEDKLLECEVISYEVKNLLSDTVVMMKSLNEEVCKVENGKILSVTTEGETMTVNEILHNCVFAEAVIDSILCKYIAMCAYGYTIKKLVLPKDFYYVGINNPNDENDVIVIQNNKRFIFD